MSAEDTARDPFRAGSETVSPPAKQLPVIFLLHSFDEGGIERSTITLAEELLRRGHAVHAICYKSKVAFDLPVDLDVRSLDVRRAWHPLRFYERCARRLDDHLDDIHARRGPGLVFASSIHKIVVRSRHRARIWFRHHGPWRPRRKPLRPRRLRETHYAGLRHLAVSRGVAKSLACDAGLPPDTIRVIHDPFNLDEIRQLGAESCDAPSDPYLVHVGRFDMEQKRHDLLLHAFRASGVEGKLVLVGSGRDRERIERMVGELGLQRRVVLAGFQKNPYPYIRRARASILSSDFEGFGRVVVESLALGTPVVSTDTDGMRDIFPANRSSPFLVPPGDEGGLARAIREVWDLPPAPERLRVFAEPFSVEGVATEYLGLADFQLDSAVAAGGSVRVDFMGSNRVQPLR